MLAGPFFGTLELSSNQKALESFYKVFDDLISVLVQHR